jgi:hypothetical protein
MISIEQVRLLESRVAKAIGYVEQVTEENALLKGKLDVYQKRIDELEVLIQRFKEDQNKIEDGILSALDRLNKFEDAMGEGISKAKAETTGEPAKPLRSVKAPAVSSAPVASAPSAPPPGAPSGAAAPGALYTEEEEEGGEEAPDFVFTEDGPNLGSDDEELIDSDGDDANDGGGEDPNAGKNSAELDIF